MVKVVIFGSRNITDEDFIWKHFDALITDVQEAGDYLELIRGGAVGVDSIIEKFAKNSAIPIEVIKPDYEKFNDKRIAPLERNKQMVEKADYGMCFWDGKSRGTMHTIMLLVEAGKTVIIHGYKKQEDKP